MPALDADTRLILDVDLSILGQPPHVFDHYESAVRAEYHWVPAVAYRVGRRKVLRSFVDRDRIYQTDPFFGLYEKPARENLKNALAAL